MSFHIFSYVIYLSDLENTSHNFKFAFYFEKKSPKVKKTEKKEVSCTVTFQWDIIVIT